MFKRLEALPQQRVNFSFNGQSYQATTGEPLACALLAAGVNTIRQSPISGSPRGPWCMMGACFECLVKIDGETVPACMTPIVENLQVESISLVPSKGTGTGTDE